MSGRYTIVRDDPKRTEVSALLKRHLVVMAKHCPPESIHALDEDGLSASSVTFWSVLDGDAVVGCAALQELTPTHGEIKSMHTITTHLRQGIASSMLEYLILEARRRKYDRLSLETGSMDAYEPARKLYTKFGFKVCEPFAGYTRDPNSTFMTRGL